jgi:hypothetical protein
VHNDFGAGLARTLGGSIGRAIINHKNVVESLASPANDVADMFFILIRRNDCGSC